MQDDKIDKLLDKFITTVIITLAAAGLITAGYYLIDMIMNGLGGN